MDVEQPSLELRSQTPQSTEEARSSVRSGGDVIAPQLSSLIARLSTGLESAGVGNADAEGADDCRRFTARSARLLA